MKSLYVMGIRGSGKTALLLGLALRFREEGLRVSYLKPVGAGQGEGKPDLDALLLREALGLALPPEVLVPVSLGPLYLSGWQQEGDKKERIREAARQAGEGVDLLLLGGSEAPFAGLSLGLDDISLAAELQAAPLLVARVLRDNEFDLLLLMLKQVEAMGLKPAGVVLNSVPRPLLGKAEGVYGPLLQKRGYPLAGVVPERPELASPTVEEFKEALGAEVLAGEAGLGRIVEDVLVGAMTMEGALRYLRRSPNKAVILGGDRSDLALAALETSTSALILTGGLYPDVGVLNKAGEKAVPVLLVNMDTYTAIERLHTLSRRLKPGDQRAAQVARQNVEKYLDWKSLLD